MVLPLVWIACICTFARSASASAASSSLIQLNWMFCRVVKWPQPRSYLQAIWLKPRSCRDDSRSEEHTSELQSLMRISYAVFCLKTKTISNAHNINLGFLLSLSYHIHYIFSQ